MKRKRTSFQRWFLLSRMFRYSSRWEDGPEVRLQEEITQIGHYLTIIQTRLAGRLTIEMKIDEPLDEDPSAENDTSAYN